MSKELPRTAKGRRTRAAIVDAAASMMYDHGVAGTTLDDVLAASETGKSQLYHYFSDKSDLVEAVIARQLERVLAARHAWPTSTASTTSTPGPLRSSEITNNQVGRSRAPSAHLLQN